MGGWQSPASRRGPRPDNFGRPSRPPTRSRSLTPRRPRIEPILVFAISCALALLLLIALLGGGTPPSAEPHPGLAPMLRTTGEGGGPAWAGWVVGLLIVALMGSLIALGVRRRAAGLRRLVWIATGAYGVVFAMLMWTAGAYEGGATGSIAGFPTPTAWLVYGIGLFPALLFFVLLRGFERAFFDEADQAAFEEILRAKEGEPPGPDPSDRPPVDPAAPERQP